MIQILDSKEGEFRVFIDLGMGLDFEMGYCCSASMIGVGEEKMRRWSE